MTMEHGSARSWNERDAVQAILSACAHHERYPQDAQWITCESTRSIALSTDHIGAREAFPDEDVRSVVRRGAIEALSDLAAVGARVIGIQLDLVAPGHFTMADFSAVGQGMNDVLTEYGGKLLQASNLSLGEFGVSYTVVGYADRSHRLTRQGAQSGDQIFIAGRVGGWNAALAILNSPEKNLDEEEWSALRDAFVDYRPQLEFGQLLAASKKATSCIDANDCLDKTLRDLVDGRDLQAHINTASLPLHPLLAVAARETSLEPLRAGVVGISGDNSLVFSAPASALPDLRALGRDSGVPIARVGVLRTGKEAAVYDRDLGEPATDLRPVDIYAETFSTGIELQCPRFGRGGRILNKSKACV